MVIKRGLWSTCMAQVVASCKAGDAGRSHEPSALVQKIVLIVNERILVDCCSVRCSWNFVWLTLRYYTTDLGNANWSEPRLLMPLSPFVNLIRNLKHT
jgi:hypothetical protein